MNLIPDSQSLVCSFCLLANTFLDVDKSQTLLPNWLLTSEDDGLFIVLLMAPASSSATEVPIQADPVHNHANHDKSSFKVLALWRCWSWVCWQAAFRKIGSRESLGIQIGEETEPKFWQFQRWQQILSTFRSRSLPLVELNSKVLAPPSHRSRQESIEICHQKLHDWVWTCHICADNPILARKFSEAGPSFLLRSFYFHEVTSHKSNLKLFGTRYPVFAGLWGGRPDTAATRGEGGDNAAAGRPAGRTAGPAVCAGGSGSSTGDGSGRA